jgi:glycosyltransferase involved in cell wall biosynthesis
MRSGLSVVLITRNEAARIGACLDSVRWADEIVVVDQHSADDTAAICRARGARVLEREMTAGFGEQKNFAIAQATQPWVLSLDADEEVTEPLRDQIETVIAEPGALVGFRMPRLTSYLGRFIRHCGWYPSPVLRLFRRGHGRFTSALVHEELVVDGPVGDLTADLLHRSYDTLGDHVRKLLLYTAYDARMLERRGARAGLWGLAVKPPAVFARKYVVQRGYREGWHGFVLSAMAALVVLVNYVRLAELTGRLPVATAPVDAPGAPPTVLLMANFADLVGGGEESLLALAAHLDRHRVRPIAAVPAEGDVAERLRALGIPVTVLPLPRVRPWSLPAGVLALRRLRALLRRERVALVHAQGSRGALYAGLAAPGTPLVWHARTADRDRWLDPILVRLAHTIVANSGATACRFRPWSRVRVSVVPNGVELGRFTARPADPALRRSLGVAPDALVVGYVGRLEPGKGPDVLLAAAERLVLKLPAVTLLFVGDGPLRHTLASRAAAAGVRAVFTGRRTDVPALLRACEVIAVPSRQEAFGRVLIEAMASHVPVVASAVGGIPEVCADGLTGLLVPAEDPDALATALAATLGDPVATAARVRAAAADVAARFDIHAHAKRVHAIYDAVLRRGRGEGHSGNPPRVPLPNGGRA